MDIEIVRRICLARHLQGLARDHLHSSNDLYLFSTVNLLQDAVESFLLALSDAVGAQIDQRTTFDKYFVNINERIAPKELPFKTQLLRLNRIRVDSKHYGIQPARSEVERLEVSVGEFFEEACIANLGSNFLTLSTIDLLNEGETKEILTEARRCIERGELDECAILCRKALYLEIESKYDISQYRENAPGLKGLRGLLGPYCDAPSFAKNADYIRNYVKSPTDYIVYDRVHLQQELSILKVDATSYWNVWRLTPEVYRDENNKWYVKRDFDKLDYEILVDKIQYIYDTTINIVFSIHSVRNTIRTAEYQKYHITLHRDEAPVYEKADRNSAIVRTVPKGLFQIDCDHCVDGFEGDGPYWYVAQFLDKDFVVGYIHNDYLVPNEPENKEEYGFIKWFDKNKGYGFVKADEGDDLFLHLSKIKNRGAYTPSANERVKYRREDSPKGPVALDLEYVPNK